MSKINFNTLHESFKNRVFKYAKMLDVIDESKPIKHQILCKNKGRGQQWGLLGNDGVAFEYETEKEARKDVMLLNNWQSQTE